MTESFSSLVMVILVSLTFKCCTLQAFPVFKGDQLRWPVFRIKVDHLSGRSPGSDPEYSFLYPTFKNARLPTLQVILLRMPVFVPACSNYLNKLVRVNFLSGSNINPRSPCSVTVVTTMNRV
jgi:hypothetical protein